MESLDLRSTKPRPARAELAGVVFLPRTIDKARASLPGGHLGEYRFGGFSEDMLEAFGISIDDFVHAVSLAESDAEVGVYVNKHAKPESIAAWNEYVSNRKPFDGDREKQIRNWPWIVDRPDLTLALDILDEDDRLLYAD